MIIDVAIPGDKRVSDKEQEKIEKCSFLKDETGRLWQMNPGKDIAVRPLTSC